MSVEQEGVAVGDLLRGNNLAAVEVATVLHSLASVALAEGRIKDYQQLAEGVAMVMGGNGANGAWKQVGLGEVANIGSDAPEMALAGSLAELNVPKEKRGLEPKPEELAELEAEGLEEVDVDDLLADIPANDSVALYFKEMSKTPLLTHEEEIDLAKKLEMGRAAGKKLVELLLGGDLENDNKVRGLVWAIDNGKKSREYLIKANTRLVVSIAKKYQGQGLGIMDLTQQGNLGLMTAVEKYDYRLGNRFSTYATWWIRQTITRGIADQGRTIRLPVHMGDRIKRMYKGARILEQELGRWPTPEEIGVRLEIEPRKVKWMIKVSQDPLALEEPTGEDEDEELGNFIEDTGVLVPPDEAGKNLLRETLEKVLAGLTPRQAKILKLRFGLQDGQQYTLEQVGQKFGVTRERIRQIEGQALRRLRHPSRAHKLKDYL